MLNLPIPTYAVATIKPDQGYVLPVAGTTSGCGRTAEYESSAAPPQLITMSRNGRTIVFAEAQSYPACGGDRIVLLQSGRRIRIPLPMGAENASHSQNFHVSRLTLGDDGALFATVADLFSGAYMGTREMTFVRSDGRWKPVIVRFPQKDDGPRNVSVGSAASVQRFAVNANYNDAVGTSWTTFQEDPTYYAPSTALVVNRTPIFLGRGTITSSAGPYVAGYIDMYQHNDSPKAVRWEKQRRTTLGKGVAFGVDFSGTVVGDDRDSWGSSGRPTLWRRGRSIQLTSKPGSAFAIRSGIVVGTSDDRAFVWRAGAKLVRYLDATVTSGYHISSAFAIAASGRILALGRSTTGGTQDILILSPRK